MDFLTFDQLQARLRELYNSGDAPAALDLLSTQAPNFPEYQPLLAYWESVLEAHLGNAGGSVRRLNAMLDQGTWYSPALLHSNPAFKSLQGEPQFQALLARNQALREADPTAKIPLLTVRPEDRCHSGGPTCPLLFALHANYSSAQAALPFWQPAAASGWLVAAPQSSQALWRGASVWDDLKATRQDAQQNLNNLQSQYALDMQRLVLAGNGMGAEAAAWLAFSDAIQARGLVLIGLQGPFTADPARWFSLLADYGGPELRVYLIVGEEDNSVNPDQIEKFAQSLVAAGFATELEFVPQLGAADAEGYESSVERALEFVFD